MIGTKPHLAGLVAAVDTLCRILDKWYPTLVTYMDGPEVAALAGLKAACEAFNATRPIQD